REHALENVGRIARERLHVDEEREREQRRGEALVHDLETLPRGRQHLLGAQGTEGAAVLGDLVTWDVSGPLRRKRTGTSHNAAFARASRHRSKWKRFSPT